jgi:hypothetical protein
MLNGRTILPLRNFECVLTVNSDLLFDGNKQLLKFYPTEDKYLRIIVEDDTTIYFNSFIKSTTQSSFFSVVGPSAFRWHGRYCVNTKLKVSQHNNCIIDMALDPDVVSITDTPFVIGAGFHQNNSIILFHDSYLDYIIFKVYLRINPNRTYIKVSAESKLKDADAQRKMISEQFLNIGLVNPVRNNNNVNDNNMPYRRNRT